MNFAEAADADGLAQVDMAGDGGGADVEPVGGLRGEFVGVGGLDGVDPACVEDVSFVVCTIYGKEAAEKWNSCGLAELETGLWE